MNTVNELTTRCCRAGWNRQRRCIIQSHWQELPHRFHINRRQVRSRTRLIVATAESYVKLATERTQTPDGRLLVVSRDLTSVARADRIAATLQEALERWDRVAGSLQSLYEELNAGAARHARPFDARTLAAPLPRAWQWLDGSAFPTHGHLMQKAFNLPPIETDRPLMYQGLSHEFLGASDDVPLPSEEDGIDFEGEFGVITSAVPMGTPAASAARYTATTSFLSFGERIRMVARQATNDIPLFGVIDQRPIRFTGVP